MKMQFLLYGIILAVILIIIWIGTETFTQPGISDLKGTYSEVASFRNENNTGPITRIYAVYTADTLWEDMESYGNFMPHTKYGNTKVFFFSDPENTPKRLVPEPPHFDPKHQNYCIGKYEKSAMGEVSMKKFPFR